LKKVADGGQGQFGGTTISDTDLICRRALGSVQLLLYSVFPSGNATNNVFFGESLSGNRRETESGLDRPISFGRAAPAV